jgi:hypothetical protein
MDRELDILRQRVERLEAGVGDIRTTLRHCLQVADKPEDAMMLARRIIDGLSTRILEDVQEKPKGTLEANLRVLESDAVLSRGLVPNEIITLLHMVRVIGNKAAHDSLKIHATVADVDLVLRSVLRVIEWYFAEFKRGPLMRPLFRGPEPMPPLETDALPPATRLPALVVVGPDTGPGVPILEPKRRKVFLFTDRLIGFGREKTSRDPRVDVVTRLLPAPDPSHPNFNLNLENVSRFHAQLWWQLGRAEIRDEDSDKGVLLDRRPIAPGVWTLCSFPDPAKITLGPRGVEFSVAEIVRQVDGLQVPCLKLARLGNWPYHEYMLISRPLVTVGADPGVVAFFPDVAPLVGTLASGAHGWELRVPDGGVHRIEPGVDLPIGASGLVVRRASEMDFLS